MSELPIPIQLAVEDDLSETVLRSLLRQSGRPFTIGSCFKRGGSGYLKERITGFNHASRHVPFLVLTDLDQFECAPVLIQEWLPQGKTSNLLFRIAVREVESWLMADRKEFARYLGVSASLIPHDLENINRPKEFLINLAKRTRKRKLQEGIVPPQGSTRRQGPDYNGRLIPFVRDIWKAERAMANSPSLSRTLISIAQFQPTMSVE